MRASRSPCSRSRPRPPCCSSRRSLPTCSCSRSARRAASTPPTSSTARPPQSSRPSATTTRNISAPRSRPSPVEKAGIFKRGCPAVIAPQDYIEADQTLLAEAERIGAAPILVGQQDFSVHEEGGRLVYQDENGSPRPAAPETRRAAPIRQCRDGDRGPARGRLRAVRNLRLRGGRDPRRMAGPPAAPQPGPPAGDSRRRIARSGSTAATTPMAAGCLPPPWPT